MMTAVRISLQALALASFALADISPPSFHVGSAPSYGFSTFTAAGDSPNVTNSVSFKHIDTSAQGDWSWTVGVSVVSMANSSALNDNLTARIPDAHQAYTTWKFAWPESSDSLNQALQEETNASHASYPSCALIFNAIFPSDVSDSWNASSSDCASALGSDCVAYLRANWTTSARCMSIPFSLADPGLIEACATSFGALGTNKISWGVTPRDFGNASDTNATSAEKNGVYAYAVSEPFSPGNTTAFDQQANNLQVLLLTGEKTNLLCNRAGNGSSASTGHGNAVNVGLVAVCLAALATMMINA